MAPLPAATATSAASIFFGPRLQEAERRERRALERKQACDEHLRAVRQDANAKWPEARAAALEAWQAARAPVVIAELRALIRQSGPDALWGIGLFAAVALSTSQGWAALAWTAASIVGLVRVKAAFSTRTVRPGAIRGLTLFRLLAWLAILAGLAASVGSAPRSVDRVAVLPFLTLALLAFLTGSWLSIMALARWAQLGRRWREIQGTLQVEPLFYGITNTGLLCRTGSESFELWESDYFAHNLHVQRDAPEPGDSAIGLHRKDGAWNQAEVTWSTRTGMAWLRDWMLPPIDWLVIQHLDPPLRARHERFEPFLQASHQIIAAEGEMRNAAVAVQRAFQHRSRLVERAAVWEGLHLPEDTLRSLLSAVELFEQGDSAAPTGLLLYGPPGTGKSEIARRLADGASCSFLGISAADLKTGHVGGTEEQVRDLWKKARDNAPCILFVDECDADVTPFAGPAVTGVRE